MARCCASRDALHTRIAETLEREFAEIAESQRELLAHQCTEAGLLLYSVLYGIDAGQTLADIAKTYDVDATTIGRLKN
jgi:hypothetical protein